MTIILYYLRGAAGRIEAHAVPGEADVAAVRPENVETDEEIDLAVLDDGEGASQIGVPDAFRKNRFGGWGGGGGGGGLS